MPSEIKAAIASHEAKYHLDQKARRQRPLKTEDCQKILDHWNAQKKPKSGWKTHRSLLPDIVDVIKIHLRKWTTEQICQAISNYAKVFHGKEYRWTYKKWGLKEFLNRHIKEGPKILDDFQWLRFLPNNFVEYDWLTEAAIKARHSESNRAKEEPIQQPVDRKSMAQLFEEKSDEELLREWNKPGGFGRILIERYRPDMAKALAQEFE